MTDTAVDRANGNTATSEFTPIQLAMFAPLPARMTSAANPMTPLKVTLGRLLYNEPVLSLGHDVSCATCHPLNGYGADGRRVSFGDVGHAGSRNSPSVYNAAGHLAQFWDGRASDVEEQAKGPVLNPAEMAMPDSIAVLDHMRSSPQYRAAFKAAFPTDREPINYDNVGRAIGAFERGLVTPARWDRFLAGDTTILSAAERHGGTTFVAVGCAGCHMGAYVGGASFQKLGLVKPWPTLTDSGRFKVTGRPQDMMVFKVPSLRNVAHTGPYFHDGSVGDLRQAVRLMARHQLGKELNDAQVGSIVTWLGSLTGELPGEYIANPPLPKPAR
ncbi:MAG TPA: cytochrome c peroxidase [Gemmatimonadaceae bacterium]|nr:cytochrome c peroxidase [Gemmatimonadaceae bacterium]